MKDKINTTPNGLKPANAYDDGNIPNIDLPGKDSAGTQPVEPLPESSRPRKDGPGGD